MGMFNFKIYIAYDLRGNKKSSVRFECKVCAFSSQTILHSEIFDFHKILKTCELKKVQTIYYKLMIVVV